MSRGICTLVDSVSIIFEFNIYRLYFDQIVISEGFGLVGNIGEWYRVVD